MSTSRVRPREPADLAACVVALAQIHAADGYPGPWPADPGRWLTPAGLLGAWIATVGGGADRPRGDVLGHVGLRAADFGSAEVRTVVEAESGLPAARLGSVTRLFVAPAARGRGLAEALLDAVGAEGSARGLRLVLDVADGAHAARAVYERLGWRRITSARADWLGADGTPVLVHHYLGPAGARSSSATR